MPSKNINGETEDFPWFDKSCEIKRKIFFHAKNNKRRFTDPLAKETFRHSSKLYKKQIKASFKKFQSKVVKQIRAMKHEDPKSFWKLLNGSAKERQDTYTKVTCEAFFKHFKDLGKSNESFNVDNSNMNNDLEPNTEKEIEDAIKKIKK